jgi:two-component system OmpR family response regulator
LLLVDDDQKTVDFLTRGLAELGYEVDACGSPRAALDYAAQRTYDVILLDILLPGMRGTALVRELRALGVAAPVLAITALGATDDRVAGLDAGCDDYLAKPFAFSELAARVRALTRRHRDTHRTTLSYSGVELDTVKRRVTRDGRNIDLSNREFALMTALMREPERVFTKQELHERVWGMEADTSSNVLEVYMRFLRKKVDGDPGNALLHTVRGVGYTLRRDNRMMPEPSE